ncbi:hypothetical protein QE364_003916 [Nocardioides zeae]|uniref:Uncharacterized protein n=1 Tax=Nocardioides zeae TaxID=1457234 RepID=A0ACC6INI5_9ACTN|nr:hypothetical protein [Nocardioides zeae]MDR6212185.1 hypothetical protein [Nocardioides zeae]
MRGALALLAAAWVGVAAGRRQGRVDGELDALRRLMTYELGEQLKGRRWFR